MKNKKDFKEFQKKRNHVLPFLMSYNPDIPDDICPTCRKQNKGTKFYADICANCDKRISDNTVFWNRIKAYFQVKGEINWTKLGTIIALIGLFLSILAFFGYPTITNFLKPSVLLTVDKTSGILCEHGVPSLNGSDWKIMTNKLPVGINLSNYDEYKIDPRLYYPWGFIVTITREKDVDLIEPKLIISYNQPNFFYDAYLAKEVIIPTIPIIPKIFDGTSSPRKYNKTENLYYDLDSPYKTTVFLPDLTKNNNKLQVSITFLVDLNHDCGMDFPIHFKLIEDIHKIESEDVIGTLRVVKKTNNP